MIGGGNGDRRQSDLDFSERSAVHAVPHASGRFQPGSRDCAAEPRSHVSANGTHGESDHDVERDQRARRRRSRRNPPAYADPADTTRSLSDRARAYLHTNCANCHRPQGPTPTALDLRHGTPLSQTGACDVAPSPAISVSRTPGSSHPATTHGRCLLARMSVRDANAMPPLASNVVDAAGVQLIGAWIDSLTTCQ